MSDVKDAVGEERYEQFRQLLGETFPGHPPPDDATVDGFVYALAREHGPEAAEMGVQDLPPDPNPPQPGVQSMEEPKYPLYTAHATHHRVRSMTTTGLGSKSNAPFESEFIGHLPMVRVQLPPILLPTGNPKIETDIGDVYLASDHLTGSIDDVARKFGSQLGYRPGRVDLITPARTGATSSRFGAIAVYLGYKFPTDPGPSFYIFEGGMATGEPKVLYFSPDIHSKIVQKSAYHPTAYSSENNQYTGAVTVRGHELISMWVQGAPKGSPYYIQVTVQYVKKTDNSNDPFGLLLEAAKRIALIGQNMGVSSGVPAQGALAGLAGNLTWVKKPQYGGAGTITRGFGDEEQK